MARKLASVREIKAINPIPKADAIEVAVVDGWECVVKKSENFKPGDFVVYIEIDSIVPDRPEFEFLRDRKFRVRTIKLRGQVSQGLVLPLSILKDRGYVYEEGEDVTEQLGIKKYDPEAEEEAKLQYKNHLPPLVKYLMRFKLFRKFWKLHTKKTDNGFPSWISKTDETRVQNCSRYYHDWRGDVTEFDVREKIDGQSGTYYLKKIPGTLFKDEDWEFGICSRNIKVDPESDTNYARIAKTFPIKTVLEQVLRSGIGGYEKQDIEHIVLQGEIYGTGIQGNKYGKNGIYFAPFNLKINGKLIPVSLWEEKFESWNLPLVPLVAEKYLLPPTITDLVEFSKGKSLLADRNREGLVLRNYEYGISFKVINPDFLLEEK